MANLTLSIDDEALRRARIRALEQGTSVNSLVREYIEGFAGESPAARAVEEILELASTTRSGSGPGGRKWKREELYEERAGNRKPGPRRTSR